MSAKIGYFCAHNLTPMIFILPFLAVLISSLIVLVFKPKNQKSLKLLLAFSGAFLLALTFFELLPEVFLNLGGKKISIFILLGILLQITLEFFSKGAEHGHVHVDVKKNLFPLGLFLSLSLHAFVEGFPLSEKNTMLYGVLVHKIPIALILSIFLFNSKIRTWKVTLFLILFSIMTPLGSFLAQNFEAFKSYDNELNALAAGMFFHVSTTIIFESAQNHSFNIRKLIAIVLGMVVAYFI
ncbi:ZIP family metal transporter [Allomuricauda sp. d1]|uniref:ZIP family metal transporter n=1 Tax=Allomuricauda sp. d1 TaxID=3136725 RepID=UPI0031CF2EB6